MKESHLKALLKKNLLVSKSTIILTIIEILSPIIIMLCLLGLKSLFEIENLDFDEDLKYVIKNSSLLENEYPGIKDNEVGYRGSLYMCNERNLIVFVGNDFPINLAKKFINHMTLKL